MNNTLSKNNCHINEKLSTKWLLKRCEANCNVLTAKRRLAHPPLVCFSIMRHCCTVVDFERYFIS